MTDVATDAPAPADTATAPADTVQPSGSIAPVAENDWRAALDEDTRKTADAKNWSNPAAAVKSYNDLFREFTDVKQKSLTLPTDDAQPDDWNAFYAKLGRPEKPEGYEFKLPEGLPENFPYDGKNAVEFKNWAHAAGLTPRQAQAVHDQFVKHTATTVAAMAEANSKAAQTAHESLVKVWGDPESTTYKRNQELANRAIRQQGGEELVSELKAINALGPNGEVKTPRLAMALAKIGESLYAEDTLFGGPSQGPNPFLEKSENLTEQGKIIRNDPDHARALIRAAGLKPQEWGL